MRISTILAVGALALIATGNARAEVRIGVAAPLSGSVQWSGEQMQRGARRAVFDLNAQGGVLGERIVLIPVDDACDHEQALAAAAKLIEAGVVFVDGHYCSHTSIAAAPLYEQAGILMIACSTNPRLTDEGGPNVFRVCGRDDQQGIMNGDLLADMYADGRIAILHDGQTYGQALAALTRDRLRERGVREIMFESYQPGLTDYQPLVDKLVTAAVDVTYIAGYAQDAALIIRQAAEDGARFPFVSTDAVASEDFSIISGAAGQGTRFTFLPDPRLNPASAAVVAAFRDEETYEPAGYTLNSYAAVQAWAQAAEAAGTFALDAVIDVLREATFDTVLGQIGFDDHGDAIGYDAYDWYVWEDDAYVPMR